MLSENEIYLVALNNFSKFGPQRIKRLEKFFPSFKEAFIASAAALEAAKIERNIAAEFISARAKINPEALCENMRKEGVKIATPDSGEYPRLLKEIYDFPMLLYYKGDLKGAGDYGVGVVGSRKFSAYGKQAAENIAYRLAQEKITINSGLALGIDAIAHEAALDAGGRTVAVLGTGIDRQSIYPSTHKYLAEKIIAQDGAVISEFPLGTPPLRFNFPQRNRIISGISLGVLVVEAAEKSGALITARCALEQNREVFAVPGSIFSPISAGPNNLIKQGAKPVTNAAEILETLNLRDASEYLENREIIGETAEEKTILKFLSREAVHINEIIRLSRLGTALTSSTLALMEMKGIVKNLGDMQYVLAR